MEKSRAICVICMKKGDNILKFTENTLTRCQSILTIRQNNSLLFNNVVLPLVPNEIQGYHVPCYRKYTALGKKIRKALRDQTISETSTSAGTSATETNVTSSEPSCSRTSTEDSHADLEQSTCETETSNLLCSEKSSKDTGDVGDVADVGTSDSPEVRRTSSLTCIICDKARKKHNARWQSLHTSENNSIAAKIEKCATEANDLTMLQKIDDFLCSNRIITYHRICLTNFEHECERRKPKQRTEYHEAWDCHKLAYEEVCSYVDEFVIKNKKIVYLTLLRTIYVNRLNYEYRNVFNASPKQFHSNYLETKLLGTFKNKITVILHKKQKVIVPFGESFSTDDLDKLDDFDIIQKAALLLRAKILQIERRKLPDNVTVENLSDGECIIPKNLTDFFVTLLSGTESRRQSSIKRQRLTSPFAQDAIYAVSNGRIKTGKHITLAMALKSLTSSRNVVNIINRFGHCCSYTTTEELETEATYAASSRSQICPDDIVPKPNLHTGLAYNNFDRFVDTLTGKDTLHDTVGIIFQDIVPDIAEDEDAEVQPSKESVKKRRRRTYDTVNPHLEPYSKRPRMQEVLQPLHSDEHYTPDSLKTQQRVNLAWMFTHALEIPDTPMWVGFNSLIHIDDSIKQRISYLTTINLSPTNTAVIQETMIQSLKVAEECGETYIQVSYDLAIAKVALQIQSTENPRFNNLFIHLGSFHVMMAYFKAIGKIIDNCGLSNIMIDTELLASGSINGFITGKHFNRCKRLHSMISLAISILHFKRFLRESNLEITEDIIKYLGNFCKNPTRTPVIDYPPLLEITEKYEKYREQTLNGEHGKTPQFFMIYANLIEYYLLFNASIRTANFELFKHMLPKITNLFFALNQPNYARWLVKYHHNLCKIDDTHPGLRESFKHGSFGVKRTDKPFSRQPIDLTLEQTINADAANKLTGILHFTNSIAARQRWCKSHSIRSSIISHILQKTGLTKNQDITADLEKNRIKKSTAQLNNFFEGIDRNLNPFDENIDKQKLFNISNGQAASSSIAEFLLNIEINGNELREKFISECAEDHNRFEKPIKKNKIAT
ncbi:PREDICTED: uncharacterized protein LOC105556339, partial [Vollenhovia emeryi]|uniref:uncharacterized protein LOC105556339 n=1 Tax=Vollenhovia emeryi TaxID=411798 RepID=UPI0005F4263D